MNAALRISRTDEGMLGRWFTRPVALRSSHGGLLNSAHFAESVREHKRDHAERTRQLKSALHAAGNERKPSDPWDLLPITARPTMPPAHSTDGVFELNEDGLLEAGIVRRRLDRLEAEHVETLHIYYGVIGARYEHGNQPTDKELADRPRPKADAKPEDWGQLPRVYALIHVTPQGAELLERAAALLGRGLDGTDYEKVRVHLLLRDKENYAPLQLLIENCVLAAEARYARAAAAWNMASD